MLFVRQLFFLTGAVRTLQEESFTKHFANLNAAITRHDPKARPVNKLEDFAYIRDATALLAFQDLGILDKGQKTTLGEALDLRNRCGHPTKYKPGIKRASSSNTMSRSRSFCCLMPFLFPALYFVGCPHRFRRSRASPSVVSGPYQEFLGLGMLAGQWHRDVCQLRVCSLVGPSDRAW